MVALHHEIVKALDLRVDGKVTTAGRDCIKVFYQRFKDEHGRANTEFNQQPQRVIATKAYDRFHKKYHDEVGHYFRNFHRILKFVDESEVPNKGNYTGILRAQLSSYELVLLFYNAVNPVGEKLTPLVEEYEMLESLDVGLLGNPPDEVGLFRRKAYGDQDLGQLEGRVPRA